MTKTRAEETQIAVMAANLEFIKEALTEIKSTLKQLPVLYLTLKEHTDYMSTVDFRFKRLEDEDGFAKFLIPSLSIILGSVVTFLLIQYIQHIKP